MQNSSRHLNKGFSLIELMVVMAIIMLLAAFLFKNFSGAKEKANETACVNNLKNIHLALVLYQQDNNDMLPSISTNIPDSWVGQMKSYAKNQKLFRCLSDSDKRENPGETSYIINQNFYPQNVDAKTEAIVLTSDLDEPHETVLLCEQNNNSQATYISIPPVTRDSGDASTNPIAKKRHTDQSNFMFADGSVRKRPFNEIINANVNKFATTNPGNAAD